MEQYLEEIPELIAGTHSISDALKNSKRKNLMLYATSEGLKKLDTKPACEVKIMEPEAFHQLTMKMFSQRGAKYSKLSNGLLLESMPIYRLGLGNIEVDFDFKSKVKLLALDGVTDIGNAGAIYRTAAFYGVHGIILAQKGSFSFGPGFYKKSCGGSEHLNTYIVKNLPKTLEKLKAIGMELIGLTEKGDPLSSSLLPLSKNLCLVLGAEERGLSYASMRVIPNLIKLASPGSLSTLNVSVATAICMEKFWGDGH